MESPILFLVLMNDSATPFFVLLIFPSLEIFLIGRVDWTEELLRVTVFFIFMLICYEMRFFEAALVILLLTYLGWEGPSLDMVSPLNSAEWLD